MQMLYKHHLIEALGATLKEFYTVNSTLSPRELAMILRGEFS